jgi:hypothetical protein
MSTEGEIVASDQLIDALVTLRAQQLLQQLNTASPATTPRVPVAAPPRKPSIFAKKDADPPAAPTAAPAAPPAKPSIFAKMDADPPAAPTAAPAAPPAKPSIFAKKDANPPPAAPTAPQASPPNAGDQSSAPAATTRPTAPLASGSPATLAASTASDVASPASESASAPVPETLDVAVHQVVADMGDTAALAGELGLNENELKEILADLPADFEARVAAEAARMAGEG